MAWTEEEITKLAQRRGLLRLSQAHLARWLELANAQRDTTPLRAAVACKEDEPAYGPTFCSR